MSIKGRYFLIETIRHIPCSGASCDLDTYTFGDSDKLDDIIDIIKAHIDGAIEHYKKYEYYLGYWNLLNKKGENNGIAICANGWIHRYEFTIIDTLTGKPV